MAFSEEEGHIFENILTIDLVITESQFVVYRITNFAERFCQVLLYMHFTKGHYLTATRTKVWLIFLVW